MLKKTLFILMILSLLTTGCTQSPKLPEPANSPIGEIKIPAFEPDTFTLKIGTALTEDIPYKDPQSIAVLVNKQNALPADYVPTDLVYVNIPFTFSEKAEKRMMRQEAAEQLENLFKNAKDNGIILYGISGYRSYQTQKDLFAYNVNRFGSEEKANQISARPGESEHQTGLAMDVTAQSVNYGLVEVFGDTPEFAWLQEHAHQYGFVIRYLKGKEYMTEYMYEPWHLRYVGPELATKLYVNNITYEEYLFFKI